MAWHRDGGHEAHLHEVAAGQHYVQVNAYRNVWEVKDVFNLADDIAHARLARVDEPSVVKTVSCISLTEGSFFQLVVDEDSAGPTADADGRSTDHDGVNVRWRENVEAASFKLRPRFWRRWLGS